MAKKIKSSKPKFMLGKLFGSTSRVKILKLFISQPEKRFYIRQIARDLKLQLNSVRRELENLGMFGLLTSSVGFAENLKKLTAKTNGELMSEASVPENKIKVERKYYQINPDFVLYQEIKDLVVKAQILYERDFVEKLSRIGQPKLLIFTGYFVNSPRTIDMLIVGRFNKTKLLRVIKELENELGREINYTLMGLREFKYRRDITDIFLYDILENKKIVVINELGIS